ncbi:MAG: NTP transferase domain-containing protein [Myxococcota bacterium]|nr:NTP transferase domain-containing protein [Myxococcota bacterium]
MGFPAIVTAGDRRAAKDVCGESKPYLVLAGQPLVAHVVSVLQRVPEISEVWVVGNAERLEAVLGDASFRAGLVKPLHVVPQFRNLYENGWETYRRLLPGAPAEGRDPEEADPPALFLSADLPFATPQEISAFIRRSLAVGCDYAVGLCTEGSLEPFYPGAGRPGIRMAYFNLREGRFRQSNLHWIRPGRVGHRYYIEEMYEHRYQKQFGQILALAWRLLRIENGGLAVLYYYVMMQLASIADRNGLRRLADWLRDRIPLRRIEAGVSALLDTDFRFVVTEVGGCAVDIDLDSQFEAARERYDEWCTQQRVHAERLHGPALASEASTERSPTRPDGSRGREDGAA